MMSPAFCSNCGRPLVGSAPCASCAGEATLATEHDLTPTVPVGFAPAYEPEPSARPFEGRVLPGPAPSNGASDGYATGGSFAYGGAATGAPDLSRYSNMWNWGAFFLCPFWLMNHGAVPLGIGAFVLSFVPLVNVVSSLGFGIYFGIKGNDWAASHRAFSSDAQFVAVQNAWRNWGIGLAVLGLAFSVAISVLLGILRTMAHAMH